MEGTDKIAALSFDIYGTLIDWESGIARALRPWANRHHLLLSDDAIIHAFARHETVVQTEHPDWSYPHILAEVMWRIGHDLDVSVSDIEAQAFGRSVGQWPPFADSAAALARLAQRFRLIVLSNVDRVSFRLSNDHLGVEFDAIFTAEDIGAYKPHAATFEALTTGLDSLGLVPAQLLHVAESLYHDHIPAHDHGLQTVWIHRRHAVEGYGATAAPQSAVTPQYRFTSMAEFADAILGPELG